MVSELHARKAALEAKLAEKNRELKLLCIQEAELTGILPAEIPLEPGESPPIFRRRVGTSFVFPENLINNSKPKFKEEDSISALELERQIQMGIADAALSLANDGSATKSVRRKHRSLYQQSQGRLLELETRLNTLRQPRNVSKQRKKPRPPLENEDADDVAGLLHEGGVSLSPPSVNEGGHMGWEPQHHHETLIRHSSTHDGLAFRSSRHNQALPPTSHPHLQRYGSGGPYYYGGMMISHQYSTLSSCAHSELDRCRGRLEQGASTPGYWLRYEASDTENTWLSTGPRPVPRSTYSVRQPPQDQQSRGSDRFTGSLDRRKLPPVLHNGSNPCLESWNAVTVESEMQPSVEETSHMSSVLPHHHTILPPPAETLLPGQTYPEHGLVRTQSLGSVEASKKNKEKEWYETSLDAAPNPPLRQAKADVSSDISSNLSRSSSNVSNERRPLHARSREILSHESFDTVVPFESPKNHTVVQAGKWQPYREVTKPFEMADFYKYSTKFRKNDNIKQASIKQPKNIPGRPDPPNIARQSSVYGSGAAVEATLDLEDVTPQQKGVYQPLKPMTCKPIDPNVKNPEETTPVDEAFSTEMLAWYQDQSLPRSATLV